MTSAGTVPRSGLYWFVVLLFSSCPALFPIFPLSLCLIEMSVCGTFLLSCLSQAQISPSSFCFWFSCPYKSFPYIWVSLVFLSPFMLLLIFRLMSIIPILILYPCLHFSQNIVFIMVFHPKIIPETVIWTFDPRTDLWLSSVAARPGYISKFPQRFLRCGPTSWNHCWSWGRNWAENMTSAGFSLSHCLLGPFY